MNKNKMIVLLLICFSITTSLFAQSVPTNNQDKFPQAKASAKLSYKIINTDSGTFGYDVYIDNRLVIHQNTIPALPGNKGFATKVNAEKVARLVISKIVAGETPPIIRIEELKTLNVL